MRLLTEQTQDTGRTLGRLNEKLTDLGATNDQLKQDNDQQRDRINKLVKDVARAQRAPASEDQIRRAQDAEQRALEAEKKLKKYETDTKYELDSLRRENATLHEKVKERQDVIDTQAWLSKQSKEKKEAPKETSQAEAVNTELADENAGLKDEIEKLQKRLADAEIQHAEDDNILTKLQDELAREQASHPKRPSSPDEEDLENMLLQLQTSLQLVQEEKADNAQQLVEVQAKLTEEKNFRTLLKQIQQEEREESDEAPLYPRAQENVSAQGIRQQAAFDPFDFSSLDLSSFDGESVSSDSLSRQDVVARPPHEVPQVNTTTTQERFFPQASTKASTAQEPEDEYPALSKKRKVSLQHQYTT